MADGSIAVEGPSAAKGRGLRRGLLREFRRSPAMVVSATLFVVLVVVAILAPYIVPTDPMAIAMRNRFDVPGAEHWFGTDHLGRDLWSRVIFGARLSMFVGTAVTVLATVAGTIVGLVGGQSKRFGGLVMRLVDGLLAFPGIILALALIAAFGASLVNVIIALSVVYTPRIARVVHSVVLELMVRDYVSAAEALGATDFRLILRHLLPNSIGPIVVQASFIFANAVISEAGLSFLGVGVPAGTPSWGSILSEGRVYMQNAPWITFFPGLAIFITVLSLNILGDGLRDKFDPRYR